MNLNKKKWLNVLEIDECMSLFCLNNVICIDDIDLFFCVCWFGFIGIVCEIGILF